MFRLWQKSLRNHSDYFEPFALQGKRTDYELWIALTTAVEGAFTTFLEYKQVENTLVKYNQTATDLANIKAWWVALTNQKKQDPSNIKNLVENTENILQTELTGWVQQMEDALAKLKAQQISKKEPLDSDKTTN